ncbi:MAG TPA: hypothetical protein VK789_28950 [Bryobacteraceae bacterium]|jgi:hypothetical protein|nr:hypothetical protein [Bryobacteraceae bacterium]
MNAPIKSAVLYLTVLMASALTVRAEFTQTFQWHRGAAADSIYSTIAPDYSMNSTQTMPDPGSTTPAPEAATMLLCGAGILVIFAGMGIRRSVEQKGRQ